MYHVFCYYLDSETILALGILRTLWSAGTQSAVAQTLDETKKITKNRILNVVITTICHYHQCNQQSI